MTLETLQTIGDCYRKALETSIYSVDLPHNFSKELQSIETNNTTEKFQLNNYIHQLEICYFERNQTLRVTDLVEDIIFTAYHLVLWYNATHKKKIYTDLSFRRKSFESEFRKSLKRTLMGKSPRIKDRFGCRFIIRNKETEIVNQGFMYDLTNLFIDMYCGLSSSKKDFLDWCENNSSLSEIAFTRITNVLTIPFELVEADPCYDTGITDNDIVIPKQSGILDCFKYGVKDYAYTPKERGYQSIHFVLHIDATSPIFPGLYVEFQGRTSVMHSRAEDKNSKAYHGNHKDNSSLVSVDDMEEKVSLDDIIKFDDISKINIIGYDHHILSDTKDSFEDDTIGIRHAVCPYTRKIVSPYN